VVARACGGSCDSFDAVLAYRQDFPGWLELESRHSALTCDRSAEGTVGGDVADFR